jgi:hypothetical protein
MQAPASFGVASRRACTQLTHQPFAPTCDSVEGAFGHSACVKYTEQCYCLHNPLLQALASSGVASRRACIDLVKAGKVKVNGVVVTDPATKVRGVERHGPAVTWCHTAAQHQ